MWKRRSFLFLLAVGCSPVLFAMTFIPANSPSIQYFGRWDMTDSLHPRYSWPGVYICAEFTGTRIGIRIADGTDYFNVYIDGKLRSVFHGTERGEADYILADSLENTRHSFRLSRRNITFEPPYAFSGIIVDDGARLLPPPPEPARKIEFVGDSYTAAESDEATAQELPWEARYPVTNIDKGFASLIAQHFHAQYHMTCRSGSGMYCDWKGEGETIPSRFGRTLMEASEPQWDFSTWIPDLVVVCLGLNDYSGLKDKEGKVSDGKSALFRKAYAEFLATLRKVYPKANILAIAAYEDWIRENVKRVVDEKRQKGDKDIFYTQFDRFGNGYVASDHPTVATHQKMADQLIQAMESFNLFPPDKEGN